MSKKSGLGKVLFGAAVGVGLGLVFAPQTGTETRKILKKKLDELTGKLKEIDPSEVKETIITKLDDLKLELSELDKEKVLAIAKEQAQVLQKKADELYKYAVKKGTPVLEKAADEVRIQVVKVAKEVTKRLESEQATENLIFKKPTKLSKK